MKIIEEQHWIAHIRCSSCGSFLEITEGDVYAERWSDRADGPGATGYRYYVICPREGCDTNVNVGGISPPEHVKRLALRRIARSEALTIPAR